MTASTATDWRSWDPQRKAEFLYQLKLEAEARRTLWKCRRPNCDGLPHKGAPSKHARFNQLPPVGEWLEWVFKAGRGTGKTRSAAEWVRGRVNAGVARRIGLVARTKADYRDVMVEGESGLLEIFPRHRRPDWQPTKRRVVFHNGAAAYCYSAEEPDQLRGPQHDTIWGDEVSTWPNLGVMLYNIRFGLRLGKDPRACYTGTPRPTAAFKKLLAEPGVAVTHGTTFDNLGNLAPTFKAKIVDPYDGTRIGRQELYGDVLDSVENAMWTWDSFLRAGIADIPPMLCTVVSVDPAVTSETESDLSGLAVCGLGIDHLGYLLHSEGVKLAPNELLDRVVELYDTWDADYVVAETNNGGDFIENLLKTLHRQVNYQGVNATRGKRLRAEPVSALYDQHRVYHVGPAEVHAPAEVQMTSWTGQAESGESSPDLLDAVVHGFTKLMIDNLPNTVLIAEWLEAAHQRDPVPQFDGGDVIYGVVEEDGKCLATCARRGPNILAVGTGNLVVNTPNSRVVVWSESNVSILDWVMPTQVFYPWAKSAGYDASGEIKFKDLASEHWWRVREAFKPDGGLGLVLPRSGSVDSELMAPTWRLRDNKIVVQTPQRIYVAKALLASLTVNRGGTSKLSDLVTGWK